jgi:hypothetical protein
MVRKADTIGVFQIESHAQMAMLPRLAPRRFYDLMIEVAIVPPGPIQGDMVHSNLRHSEGRSRLSFPNSSSRRYSARHWACRFSGTGDAVCDSVGDQNESFALPAASRGD